MNVCVGVFLLLLTLFSHSQATLELTIIHDNIPDKTGIPDVFVDVWGGLFQFQLTDGGICGISGITSTSTEQEVKQVDTRKPSKECFEVWSTSNIQARVLVTGNRGTNEHCVLQSEVVVTSLEGIDVNANSKCVAGNSKYMSRSKEIELNTKVSSAVKEALEKLIKKEISCQ